MKNVHLNKMINQEPAKKYKKTTKTQNTSNKSTQKQNPSCKISRFEEKSYLFSQIDNKKPRFSTLTDDERKAIFIKNKLKRVQIC